MEEKSTRIVQGHRVWPSPFNEPVRTERRAAVEFADCTLRDGEQQAGVALDRHAKLEIAHTLDELGVYEIEAATPASGDEDRSAVRDICRAGLHAKISVVSRALVADIDEAVALGVWGVRISFPIGPLQRKHKLKDITHGEYVRRAVEVTAHAKKRGLYVVFSPYDTTRVELPFLLEVVGELAKAGVDRLRIVDTTGCATPEGISRLVRDVAVAAPDLPLEIHCHDDFGLATANTVAAVVAGAAYVSSTINGIGERSGNAATEEVALVLEGLYGIATGLDLGKLAVTSSTVARLSQVPLAPNKAVTGAGAFRHEAGMVVAGVLQDPFTAEPYEPLLVGQTRQIVVGKKSGLAAIAYKVRESGLKLAQENLVGLLEAVKSLATEKGRALTDAEFIELAKTGAITRK